MESMLGIRFLASEIGGFGVEAPGPAGQVMPEAHQRPRSYEERRLHRPLFPGLYCSDAWPSEPGSAAAGTAGGRGPSAWRRARARGSGPGRTRRGSGGRVLRWPRQALPPRHPRRRPAGRSRSRSWSTSSGASRPCGSPRRNLAAHLASRSRNSDGRFLVYLAPLSVLVEKTLQTGYD